ncbi:MAG: hypothetical protein IJ246_04705 [Clostridia bacterium]|nr:hypothetical protein [Clostridia bacterium]
MANEARHIQPIGAKRGTYSKLNPQFAEIVDFFCSSEEDADRLSDSSIRSSASKATQFLYYLQKKGLISFDDVKEEDIISFFVKDGKPVYETSYRYRLSEFFEAVSGKYPVLSTFSVYGSVLYELFGDDEEVVADDLINKTIDLIGKDYARQNEDRKEDEDYSPDRALENIIDYEYSMDGKLLVSLIIGHEIAKRIGGIAVLFAGQPCPVYGEREEEAYIHRMTAG